MSYAELFLLYCTSGVHGISKVYQAGNGGGGWKFRMSPIDSDRGLSLYKRTRNANQGFYTGGTAGVVIEVESCIGGGGGATFFRKTKSDVKCIVGYI